MGERILLFSEYSPSEGVKILTTQNAVFVSERAVFGQHAFVQALISLCQPTHRLVSLADSSLATFFINFAPAATHEREPVRRLKEHNLKVHVPYKRVGIVSIVQNDSLYTNNTDTWSSRKL